MARKRSATEATEFIEKTIRIEGERGRQGEGGNLLSLSPSDLSALLASLPCNL